MLRESFTDGWTVTPLTTSFAALSGQTASRAAVTLPHDALRDAERTPDSPNGSHTGFAPSGSFAYEKTFDVPEQWRGRVVVVEFEGVYRDAVVFLNGDFVTQRPNGYTAFAADLTPALRYGEPNTVRVEARTHQDSRWYTGAGIHRDVWLAVSDPVRVPLDGVRVTTIDADAELATLAIDVEIANATMHAQQTVVRMSVVGPDGDVLVSDDAVFTALPHDTDTLHLRSYVPQPRLWDVDSPALHRLRVQVVVDATVVDETETVFGIRTLAFDPQRGLRLNGRALKLRGGCIHHDNGPLGAAAHARAEERRVEILKAAGYNAVRSSHNHLSRAFLDAADHHGLLVWDELSDVWTRPKTSFDYSLDFPEWWERDLESMVRQDVNHPSVIMYSIGNEIFEVGSPVGATWGRRLANRLRELDDTRIVTNAINALVAMMDVVATQRPEQAGPVDVNAMMSHMEQMMNGLGASELAVDRLQEAHAQLDVSGLNYSEESYAPILARSPQRMLLGSETFPGALDRIWPLVEASPAVIGDFAWTAWDYLGEVGIGRPRRTDAAAPAGGGMGGYPGLLAQCGTIDILGRAMPIAAWRQIVWGLRDEPFLAAHRPEIHGLEDRSGGWSWDDVLDSWSWRGADGTPIVVDVYADADEVELIVNGESRGRVAVGAEKAFIARFDTTYTRGEIIAIAYRDGTETGRTALRTRADEVGITAHADRTRVNATGDLAYVDIALADASGIVATDLSANVVVEVSGTGELTALASADPEPGGPYTGSETSTYDGRAQAIIRPTGTGDIRVRVSAEGFGSTEIVITAA